MTKFTLALMLLAVIIGTTKALDKSVISDQDRCYLFRLHDTFQQLLQVEKNPQRNQYAVFVHGSDMPDFKSCKKQAGNKIFLTQPLQSYDPQLCPFIAARLPLKVKDHTEKVIFDTMKPSCPTISKAYLFTYLSPCVNCDNEIETYANACADVLDMLVVGYLHPYKDVKASIAKVKGMDKVAMTQIDLQRDGANC